jgi:hypothetical protein
VAAPSVRNVGTAVFDTVADGSIDPVNPVHQAGDILICLAGSSANASVTPTHSVSGWTLLGTAANTTGTIRARISAYWKRATGSSETSPTVVCTPTLGTAAHHSAVVISYQDCIATGDPFEGLDQQQTAGASTIAVTRGATTTERLSVIATHHADNVATGASENHADAYTQRIATDNNSGIDGFLWIADFGPVDDDESVTVTYASGGTSVGIAGLAFALLPLSATEATGRFAGTATLEKTSTARVAGTATLEKTSTARFAGTANLEKTATGRFAGTATLAAEAAARLAGTATLERTTTARLAGTADLQIPATTETSRFAGTATLEKTGTARLAGTALLEGTVTARLAGLATLETTSTGRFAGVATLEKTSTGRLAGLATLAVTATGRLAGTALLERTVSARFAGTADPQPPTTIETARFAGLATLERTAIARLAGVALLERISTARFAGAANLGGAEYEGLGRLAGTAFLRRIPIYESSASGPGDFSESAGSAAVLTALAVQGGNRDAGGKAG